MTQEQFTSCFEKFKNTTDLSFGEAVKQYLYHALKTKAQKEFLAKDKNFVPMKLTEEQIKIINNWR